MNKKTYIILDFEATCSNDGKVPRNEMEIIEFGVVAVDYKSLEAIDEFQRFVQPVRHNLLTNFCQELTTIQQKDVDNADGFSRVLAEFKEWLAQFSSPIFCSWGGYDKKQLLHDCAYHKVEYPFDKEHINLKNVFSKNQKIKKRFGMKKALEKANITLEGTHHRGIDDARNMVKLMPYIVGDVKLD
ncbi:exonuclease domain-containing protein [Candidatus Uabimicrobium sp. HlEnr_7]|uniref:exonuclease domain-containing protein n=1 Tax=Candidatus Uabimicrobium helgolandensis TaxID=3095367 RepID=UPI003556111D